MISTDRMTDRQRGKKGGRGGGGDSMYKKD